MKAAFLFFALKAYASITSNPFEKDLHRLKTSESTKPDPLDKLLYGFKVEVRKANLKACKKAALEPQDDESITVKSCMKDSQPVADSILSEFRPIVEQEVEKFKRNLDGMYYEYNSQSKKWFLPNGDAVVDGVNANAKILLKTLESRFKQLVPQEGADSLQKRGYIDDLFKVFTKSGDDGLAIGLKNADELATTAAKAASNGNTNKPNSQQMTGIFHMDLKMPNKVYNTV